MKEKFFIVDGHNLIYKAYFAFARISLSTRDGRPTGAIYGFVKMLLKLIQNEKPKYLAVTFDDKWPTKRQQEFPSYKANRQIMPDDLITQVPIIFEILQAFRVKILQKPGFEADDLIGTLAKKASEAGFEVLLVSNDKDLTQLVNAHIKLLRTKKGVTDLELMDEVAVEKEFGVKPGQMVDYLSLVGDPVDNVPGIKGVGAKTASKILKEYDSLDNLLSKLEQIPETKLRQAIEKDRSILNVNRYKLIPIVTDLPIQIEPQDCLLQDYDREKLRELFSDLEFKHLLVELAPVELKNKLDYNLITTLQDLDQLLKILENQDKFSLHLLTNEKRISATDLKPLEAELIGIAISWQEYTASYIPVGNKNNSDQLPLKLVLENLKNLFENTNKSKLGHDLKKAILILANYGLNLAGLAFDTMVASYLLKPAWRQHSLDKISIEYLQQEKKSNLFLSIDEEDKNSSQKLLLEETPLDKLLLFACEEADLVYRMTSKLEDLLKQKDLFSLFVEVEMPLIPVLAEMEKTGVKIDLEVLSELSEELDKQMAVLEKDIFALCEGQFNINSPKQLAEVLFEKLNLSTKGLRKTKTGISTDEENLILLAEANPLFAAPTKILEYRKLAKLKSTYVDALPKMVSVTTARVHTSFNQTITETGRLSSSEPNLQNIPIRTELGRRIRQAFIPESPNSSLLSADYSQVELRILASLAQDEVLLEAFRKGLDIHAHTASELFGVPIDKVDNSMRDVAKTVNFGIDYGMTEFGLAKRLNIGRREAREYIERYLQRYHGVRKYIEQTKLEAAKNGFVTTLLKRRREIPQIYSKNKMPREAAERQAINMPIQGTAAELIKIAMIDIHKKMLAFNLKSKMILQVHDELVFEVSPGEETRLAELVKGGMENALKLDVPIRVALNFGANWAVAH